jgi:hypothetical protein
MKSHNFSYHYVDDFHEWKRENEKRIRIMLFKGALLLTPRGRWFIARAEKKYGQV